MRVTTTLSRGELAEIAAENHVQLNEYREAGHERGTGRQHHAFTIRPATGDDTYRKMNSHNGRRVWAVCWHGHYAFMAALLEEDPYARIRSAVADWKGRDDFHTRAPDTAWDEVGPMIYRHAACEDCAGNHGYEYLDNVPSGYALNH